MFDLADVRYIEGAPMGWRRWLTPGTRVVLRFSEQGVHIRAGRGETDLAWEEVSSVHVRGPEVAERRGSGPGRAGITGYLLAGPLIGLVAGAVAAKKPKVEFSWLAFRLVAGGEIIFEVEGLLRDALERLLEAHSG